MPDDTFNQAEFDRAAAKCRGFGLTLLRPKSTRRAYKLERCPVRADLGTAWSEARTRLGEGVRWVFENSV